MPPLNQYPHSSWDNRTNSTRPPGLSIPNEPAPPPLQIGAAQTTAPNSLAATNRTSLSAGANVFISPDLARREAQHRVNDTITSLSDIPVPPGFQAISIYHTLCVTAMQVPGGHAEHNPFVLPPHGSAARAMSLATQFRREIAFPFCAARAGIDADDHSAESMATAEAMFCSVFPSQNGAFVADREKGKPTGILLVQIAPGVIREFKSHLVAHHLGFIVTIDTGEFATRYNKAVVIERKINGADVHVADVIRAIFSMTGFTATVRHDNRF